METTTSDPLVEITFAKEIKESINKSKLFRFQSESLKNKINQANDDELLIIKSTIDSPKKIISVDFYNRTFLESVL